MSEIDDLFFAMAVPIRLRILELLRTGERTVTQIASALPVSQPAVSQHLKVLREADLVLVEAHGKEHHYRINPAQLERLRSYVEGFWDDVLGAYQAEAAHRNDDKTGEEDRK